MLKTILGILLLLAPFLLLYKFKDKKLGFAYILSFLIAFHLTVAIITQAFGIFDYWVIFIITLIADIFVLTKINLAEFTKSLKEIKINNIDFILIFVLIVLFIELFFIHYNYTGQVTTAVENYKEVKSLKYSYPYFSDEWSAVSLIKYSIANKKLPLVNPLWYNSLFPNLELPFHSFVSEIILLLNLNPLTQYTILTIFSGMLVCSLVYIILRANDIRRFASAVAALSVPYIVNGANLPGIWTLLPLIMGIISMLLGILFISSNKRKMVLFCSFLTLIFYPPLFVLSSISLILYAIYSDNPKKEKIKLISLYFFICIISTLILSIFACASTKFSSSFVSYIFSKIFYETFTKGAIPDFSIWKVIPIPILLFSLFSVVKFFKKKIWLTVPILIGLAYWLLYSFVLWRFIIEYERIVMSTSILIVILSGFGLEHLIKYLEKFDFIGRYKILKIIQVLILVLFFIISFSYTQRDNWQKLKLYSVVGKDVYNPAAPANAYLHEDDLALFKNIKENKFLSLPWKGLSIGVATDNYPLETKPSTITNFFAKYSDFVNADCKEKEKIAIEKEIDYIYSWEFNCTGFKFVGKSQENLYLYKVE